MIKKIQILLLTGTFLLINVVPAFAHVIVYPHQVGIATTQDFIFLFGFILLIHQTVYVHEARLPPSFLIKGKNTYLKNIL